MYSEPASSNKLDKSKNKSVQNKNLVNENQENKFSIKSILERGIDQVIDKKNLLVLSDEICDDDIYITNKKVEILLSKMMYDKTLINDKTFANNFNDLLISQIYMCLSPESKKLLLENVKKEEEQDIISYFHNLIGFSYEKFMENQVITNDILMNINSNIIKIEDFHHHQDTSIEEDEDEVPNYNLFSTTLEEVNETFENKLIFEEEKRVYLFRENYLKYKMCKQVEIEIEPTYFSEEEVNTEQKEEFAMHELIDMMKSSSNLLENVQQPNEELNGYNLRISKENSINANFLRSKKSGLGLLSKKSLNRSNSIEKSKKSLNRTNSLEKMNKSKNSGSNLNPNVNKGYSRSGSIGDKNNILKQSTKKSIAGSNADSYDKMKIEKEKELNPFINTYEVNETQGKKLNKNNSEDNKKNLIKNIFKKKPEIKKQTNEVKGRRLIKLNNDKVKFSNFEEDDNDEW